MMLVEVGRGAESGCLRRHGNPRCETETGVLPTVESPKDLTKGCCCMIFSVYLVARSCSVSSVKVERDTPGKCKGIRREGFLFSLFEAKV